MIFEHGSEIEIYARTQVPGPGNERFGNIHPSWLTDPAATAGNKQLRIVQTGTGASATLVTSLIDEESSGAGVVNLGIANRDADSLDITSSAGTDATVPSASTTQAGLLSAADKIEVDHVNDNLVNIGINAGHIEANTERIAALENGTGDAGHLHNSGAFGLYPYPGTVTFTTPSANRRSIADRAPYTGPNNPAWINQPETYARTGVGTSANTRLHQNSFVHGVNAATHNDTTFNTRLRAYILTEGQATILPTGASSGLYTALENAFRWGYTDDTSGLLADANVQIRNSAAHAGFTYGLTDDQREIIINRASDNVFTADLLLSYNPNFTIGLRRFVMYTGPRLATEQDAIDSYRNTPAAYYEIVSGGFPATIDFGFAPNANGVNQRGYGFEMFWLAGVGQGIVVERESHLAFGRISSQLFSGPTVNYGIDKKYGDPNVNDGPFASTSTLAESFSTDTPTRDANDHLRLYIPDDEVNEIYGSDGNLTERASQNVDPLNYSAGTAIDLIYTLNFAPTMTDGTVIGDLAGIRNALTITDPFASNEASLLSRIGTGVVQAYDFTTRQLTIRFTPGFTGSVATGGSWFVDVSYFSAQGRSGWLGTDENDNRSVISFRWIPRQNINGTPNPAGEQHTSTIVRIAGVAPETQVMRAGIPIFSNFNKQYLEIQIQGYVATAGEIAYPNPGPQDGTQVVVEELYAEGIGRGTDISILLAPRDTAARPIPIDHTWLHNDRTTADNSVIETPTNNEVLTYRDGALIFTSTNAPTLTSQLTNDSGFITAADASDAPDVPTGQATSSTTDYDLRVAVASDGGRTISWEVNDTTPEVNPNIPDAPTGQAAPSTTNYDLRVAVDNANARTITWEPASAQGPFSAFTLAGTPNAMTAPYLQFTGSNTIEWMNIDTGTNVNVGEGANRPKRDDVIIDTTEPSQTAEEANNSLRNVNFNFNDSTNILSATVNVAGLATNSQGARGFKGNSVVLDNTQTTGGTQPGEDTVITFVNTFVDNNGVSTNASEMVTIRGGEKGDQGAPGNAGAAGMDGDRGPAGAQGPFQLRLFTDLDDNNGQEFASTINAIGINNGIGQYIIATPGPGFNNFNDGDNLIIFIATGNFQVSVEIDRIVQNITLTTGDRIRFVTTSGVQGNPPQQFVAFGATGTILTHAGGLARGTQVIFQDSVTAFPVAPVITAFLDAVAPTEAPTGITFAGGDFTDVAQYTGLQFTQTDGAIYNYTPVFPAVITADMDFTTVSVFDPANPTDTLVWSAPFTITAAGPAGPPGARGIAGTNGTDGMDARLPIIGTVFPAGATNQFGTDGNTSPTFRTVAAPDASGQLESVTFSLPGQTAGVAQNDLTTGAPVLVSGFDSAQSFAVTYQFRGLIGPTAIDISGTTHTYQVRIFQVIIGGALTGQTPDTVQWQMTLAGTEGTPGADGAAGPGLNLNDNPGFVVKSQNTGAVTDYETRSFETIEFERVRAGGVMGILLSDVDTVQEDQTVLTLTGTTINSYLGANSPFLTTNWFEFVDRSFVGGTFSVTPGVNTYAQANPPVEAMSIIF